MCIRDRGGGGTVCKARHKLDDKIYALKKVRLHVQFDPDNDKPFQQHPAMKEIEAMTKLSHKNIVGYKGCWVEADEPDTERLKKVADKLKRRRGKHVASLGEGIDENSADDSQFALHAELEDEVEQKMFKQNFQVE